MVVLGMGLLTLASSVAAITAATAQTLVPMEFPPPGTRWISRSIDQTGSGGNQLTTYTVFEPGSFRWPLEVGKSWTSVYQHRDNLRNLRFNHISATRRVAAEEELTLPAGRYKTLRLEGENNGNKFTHWYAPSQRLVIKEINERKPNHPAGPGRTVTEVVRYEGPGGDPWYGFGLETSAAAVRRGERRRALAFYESAGKGFPHPFAWAAFGLTGVGR